MTGLSRDSVRLDMAKRLGADYTIDIETEDLRERVQEITGGDGIDVVVNVTGGGAGAVSDALAVASKECTLVLAAAGDEPISLSAVGEAAAQGHHHQDRARTLILVGVRVHRLPDIRQLSGAARDLDPSVPTAGSKACP